MTIDSVALTLAREEQQPQIKNWFEKMDGYLHWKAIGPEIHAPYRAPLSDRVLVDLAYRSNALLRLIDLRCMCDGFEVLHIKNLTSPIFITDHPCISVIPKFEMIDYLERSGIMKIVDDEVEKKRGEILAELAKRDLEVEDEGTVIKKKSAGKQTRQEKPAQGGGQFRIIRM